MSIKPFQQSCSSKRGSLGRDDRGHLSKSSPLDAGGFAVVECRVVQYVYQRRTTYYFVRRVPKDFQEYYRSSRIVICLKTSRKDRAVRADMSIAQRLDDYWRFKSR